jgi:repressor LexA
MHSIIHAMMELTKIQRKIVDFVGRARARSDAPPTVREIAQHFGFKSPNNVAQHLRLIEKKGHLRRNPGKARGIELLNYREPPAQDMVHVPLIGTIAAGAPVTAVENREGTVVVDPDLFKGQNLFALKIKGDSMKDIGILDGDIAIVAYQQAVDNNEVAAVIIDGEATLKRVIRESRRITLRAENPAYEDIVLESDRDVRIAGKLTGVIRKCR